MRRKRRVRELAGDDRAGLFARRKYRAAYRQYLRKAWPYLTAGGLVAFGATAVVAVLIHGRFARGVVVGFGAAATVAALAQWVVLASGIGPTYMGETAERWTAGELRRLHRSGWWLINHFGLDYGDLDHLLIGPAGVFAIETKWSASGWKERYADNRVASAIRQVEKAAAEVERIPEYRRLGLPKPRCGVVLWGDGATELAARHKHPRVAILHGHELRDRISAFSLINPSLTGTQAENGWRALSDHLASHEDRDHDEGPLPPSIEELTMRFLAAVISGLLGFLATAELAKVATSWWAWVPAVLLVAAVVQPMKRIAHLRTIVTGWQAGVIGTLSLAVIAASHQLIR